MEELKSCPFCGGKAKLSKFNDANPDYFVCCEKCGSSTRAHEDSKEAIKVWNRRVNEWLIL